MQSPLLQICAASSIGGSFESSWKSIKFWKCATAAQNQLAQNSWRQQNASTCVRRYYWNICSESLSYNNLKFLTKNLCLFMVGTQTLQKVCVSHCEIWSVCQKIKLVNFMISPRPEFSKNLRLDIVSSIQPLSEIIKVTRVQARSDLSRSGLIWWQLGLVPLQFKSQKSSTESRFTSQKSLADKMLTKSKIPPTMDLLKQHNIPVWV